MTVIGKLVVSCFIMRGQLRN